MKLINFYLPLTFGLFGYTCVVQAATESPALFVGAALKYDDNVYLLSDTEALESRFGENQSSDFIYELTPGIRRVFTHNDQKYRIEATGLRREYKRFNRLNFTGGEVKSSWDWYYNELWDGLLNYQFKKAQSSLSDETLRNADTFNLNQFNLRTTRHLAQGREAYFLASIQDKDYQQRDVLDNQRLNFTLGHALHTAKENSLAYELSASRGKYTNTSALDSAAAGAGDYDTYQAMIKAFWQPTPKSAFNIDIGYATRSSSADDDRAAQRSAETDYDGLVFNFHYRWQLTAKTQLLSAYERQLVDTENTQSAYTQVDRTFVQAKWAATSKTQWITRLSFSDIDFAQLSGAREDEVWAFEIRSRTQLTRKLILEAKARRQSRRSSQSALEYDSNIATVSISYDY